MATYDSQRVKVFFIFLPSYYKSILVSIHFGVEHIDIAHVGAVSSMWSEVLFTNFHAKASMYMYSGSPSKVLFISLRREAILMAFSHIAFGIAVHSVRLGVYPCMRVGSDLG